MCPPVELIRRKGEYGSKRLDRDPDERLGAIARFRW